MWQAFDPALLQQLRGLRDMVARSHQTPTKEWPLVFDDEHRLLLVVREWPDGSITAYATPEQSDSIRG